MTTLDYPKSFEKLMTQAEGLKLGNVEKVELLEKAINIADLMNKEDLQEKARLKFIEAATFANYPEKAMVAFSILLKKFDEDAEKGNWLKSMELLWKYKWVIGHLYEFPSISKEKIEAALADMEKRYLQANFGKKPVFHSSYVLFDNMGEHEKALEFFEQYENADRSLMSDCDTCSLSTKVQLFLHLGRLKEGLEAAEPILAGKKTCSTIPNQFYHIVLVPFFKQGKTGEAIKFMNKIKFEPTLKFLGIHGEIIRLKSLTNELSDAFKIFEQNIHHAVESLARDKPFHFYMGGQLLFSKLIEKGLDTIELKLPPQVAIFNTKNNYATKEVLNWIETEIEKLEKAFNARNENDYYSKLVRKNKALLEIGN